MPKSDYNGMMGEIVKLTGHIPLSREQHSSLTICLEEVAARLKVCDELELKLADQEPDNSSGDKIVPIKPVE